MTKNQREVLVAKVRVLVRSIPRDVGMYASLSEGNEPSGECLLAVYLDEEPGPHVLRASTNPQDDEMTLTELRDFLLEWIDEKRKAA